MPGHVIDSIEFSKQYSETFIQDKAAQLLEQGRITEADINRMIKGILTTCIAMGLYENDDKASKKACSFDEHKQIALQTAREGIVLLRNKGHILPLSSNQNILVTGRFVTSIHKDTGAAAVEGYDNVTMLDALQEKFDDKVIYKETPTDQEIQDADVVIMSIGTEDREGEDRDFNLPYHINNTICAYAKLNKHVVVVVNAGSGVNMSAWNDKVAAIVYAWYPGQIGNLALAEILAGEVNPSGKLPVTIEQKIEDSPAYPYIPENVPPGHFGKGDDFNLELPEYDIVYKEGVFVGYRWYDHNQIQPLYPFGFGLSYTTFYIGEPVLSSDQIAENEQVIVQCTVRNTGERGGAEVVPVYIHPVNPRVPRPPKELKGFAKVWLKPGEEKTVDIPVQYMDLAYYDAKIHAWVVDEGMYEIGTGNGALLSLYACSKLKEQS
jgi:beta-glucosidase